MNWPGITIKAKCRAIVGKVAVKRMKEVIWEKPEKGWVKINFNGATKGNPGPSGVGVIIQGCKGDKMVIGARNLSNKTNNIAEAKAALLALKLGN